MLSIDPQTGVERRHHLCDKRLIRHLKKAVTLAGIAKHVSDHTLRHPFRHASDAVWLRYPHGAGVGGAFGCVHHLNPHPCAQGRCRWHGQTAGCHGYGALNDRFVERARLSAKGRQCEFGPSSSRHSISSWWAIRSFSRRMTAAPSIPVIDVAALPGEQMTASCLAPWAQLPGATDGCRCTTAVGDQDTSG